MRLRRVASISKIKLCGALVSNNVRPGGLNITETKRDFGYGIIIGIVEILRNTCASGNFIRCAPAPRLAAAIRAT